MKKIAHDVDQLITLLSKNRDGLNWYEQAVELGWQCIGHGNAVDLSSFQRDGGPKICLCVRNRVHGARVAARRAGYVINTIKEAEDGRRDVFILDQEGNDNAAASRLDSNTRTRIPMYCHDAQEFLQVSRNPTLSQHIRDIAHDSAANLRSLAIMQNTLRVELGLEKIKLPEYMRVL